MYLYQDLLKLLDEKNQDGIASTLSQKHSHNNKDIIDKISTDDEGSFIFDGKSISNSWDSIVNKPEKIVTEITKTDNGITISYSNTTKEDIKIDSESSSIVAVGLTTLEW